MSKSLKSMPKTEQKQAIARQLRENKRGIGYWAAVDANNKKVR